MTPPRWPLTLLGLVSLGGCAGTESEELPIYRAALEVVLEEAPDRPKLYYDPKVRFDPDSTELPKPVTEALEVAGLTRWSLTERGFADTSAAILSLTAPQRQDSGGYGLLGDWFMPDPAGSYSEFWEIRIKCSPECVVTDSGKGFADYGPPIPQGR